MRPLNPTLSALEQRQHSCNTVTDLWADTSLSYQQKIEKMTLIYIAILQHKLGNEVAAEVAFLIGTLVIGRTK
jgi:DNA-binding transcriptional regulator YbjK